MMRFVVGRWRFVLYLVLFSLAGVANATGSFVLFTDPHGPVPIPVGVGSYDFSSELSGDPAEDIIRCGDGDCVRWSFTVVSESFDKGQIKLFELPDLEDDLELIDLYRKGIDFYLVTPSGFIKEVVRIQYFSEGVVGEDDFFAWLLVSYLNSARGADFGTVPEDGWRFGRDYRYTSIDLERPRHAVSFGSTYISALSSCDLCVVVYRTPEPGSLALLGLGLAGLGLSRRRKAN